MTIALEAKGISVLTSLNFVLSKFGKEELDKLISSLSKPAQDILRSKILVTDCYPYDISVVEPTMKICDMYFQGDIRGAYEMGRFGAEGALKGFYNVFIKIGSISCLASRASRVIETLYRPASVNVLEGDKNHILFQIVNFPDQSGILEQRLLGWATRTLELNGIESVDMMFNKRTSQGDPYIEVYAKWEV